MVEIEVVIPGHPSARRTLAPGGEVVIGRWASCDLPVPEPISQVSKRHLVLLASPEGLRARDLESKNGTTLNGVPLHGEATVTAGDRLVLGGLVAVHVRSVQEAAASESAPYAALRKARNDVSDAALAEDLEALERRLVARDDGERWAREQLPRLKWARSERERLQVVVDAVCTVTGGGAWILTWEGDPRDQGVRYRHLVDRGRPRVPSPKGFEESLVARCVRRGGPVWTDDGGCLPLGSHAVLAVEGGRTLDARSRGRVEALASLVGLVVLPPSPAGAPTVANSGVPGLVGRSPALLDLVEDLSTWATLPFNVLLLGERGTGKTQAAKVLHELSGSTGPFVHADVPAHLRGDTAASALFGHEKGAFTGADKWRVGWLEEAAEGTLFLDEIAEIPADLQAMLLNVLQERRFRRVGGTRDIPLTARVIGATNQPIGEPGSPFRRDLYDRLAEVEVRVPTLRDRREDVPVLAEYFLEQETDRLRRPGLTMPRKLSLEAHAVLASAEYPGNLRDLQNAVRRALGPAIREGALVVAAHHLRGVARLPEDAELEGDDDDGAGAYWERVHAFERKVLARALDAAGGNQRKAAEALGLTNQAWHRARKRVGFDA